MKSALPWICLVFSFLIIAFGLWATPAFSEQCKAERDDITIAWVPWMVAWAVFYIPTLWALRKT